MLGKRTVGGEEPLRWSWGCKPVPTPLSLPRRLERVLGAIVEIPVLTLVHPWLDLALRGCGTLQFISEDHAWDGGSSVQQFAKELLRGSRVTPALYETV